MRQLLLLLSATLLFTLFGCTQKYGINKNYAFTRIVTAGTIPVDQQGRPQEKGVKKTYLIYLEVEDTINKPQWDTAWIQNSAFRIEPLKIDQETVIIGKTAKEQQAVSLSARPGYNLWQLLLTPLVEAPQFNTPTTQSTGNEIVLSGKWKGKRALYEIKQAIELEKLFME